MGTIIFRNLDIICGIGCWFVALVSNNYYYFNEFKFIPNPYGNFGFARNLADFVFPDSLSEKTSALEALLGLVVGPGGLSRKTHYAILLHVFD